MSIPFNSDELLFLSKEKPIRQQNTKPVRLTCIQRLITYNAITFNLFIDTHVKLFFLFLLFFCLLLFLFVPCRHLTLLCQFIRKKKEHFFSLLSSILTSRVVQFDSHKYKKMIFFSMPYTRSATAYS